MKNDWQTRLAHDRAFIDAYCESAEKEKLIYPEGELKRVVMRYFKKLQ